MDSMQIIQMMASNIRDLDVDIKKVKLEYKNHPQSQPKQCFNNAFSELMRHDLSTSRYVLGYLIFTDGDSGVPMEHAVVKADGKYLDVTLPEHVINAYEFVSVVELTFSQVHDYVDEYQHAPDLYSMGRFMREKNRK